MRNTPISVILRFVKQRLFFIILSIAFTVFIAVNAICMSATAINNQFSSRYHLNTAPVGAATAAPLPDDYAEEPCLLPLSTEPTEPTIPEVYLPSEPLLPSVPLDAVTQWRIYTEACHGDPVRFCVIMAMASPESGYDPTKIGDDGASFGLVQIMAYWHKDRFAKYGFTVEDLFDPVKCCIIGIDYLEWIFNLWRDPEKDSDFEVSHKMLMYYNMGPSRAAEVISEGHETSHYSRGVMLIYEEFLNEFRFPSDCPAEFLGN